MSNTYKPKIILAVILLLGAYLRFQGLLFDYPYFFNPDEARLIEWGRAFTYPNIFASEWGTVPLILVKLMTGILNLFQISTTLVNLTVVGRIFAACLGCIIILMTFQLSKRLLNWQAGVIAATFTAFTVLLIQYAHVYSMDAIFSFLVLLAFFPILRLPKNQTKDYLLAGLIIGVTMATRLNGVLLFLPFIIAHSYGCFDQRMTWGNRLKQVLGRNIWLGGMVSVTVYLVLTPSLLMNPAKFFFEDGLVWVLLQTSGYIKSRYTLQFEGTTASYYFTNLMFWGVGPFLLVSYLLTSLYNGLKWRHQASLIILSFVVIYLYSGATSRVKFIRYSLVLFPLLNIIAALAFAHIYQRLASYRVARWGLQSVLVVIIVGTAAYALAFVSIYTPTDIRLEASQWIQTHIPPGAKIARGSNDYQNGLLVYEEPDAPEYRLIKLDFDDLYRSSTVALDATFPPFFAENGIRVSRRGKEGNDSNRNEVILSDEEKWAHLYERIRCTDYIVFTERNYALYQNRAGLFPVEHAYYQQLFDGTLGYQQIKMFERKPQVFGWQIDDWEAELTFHLFDHPSIWIFQAQPDEHFVRSHLPMLEATTATWDDKVKLIGYDLTTRQAKPNETLTLTLYWQPLTKLDRDYAIFVHLHDGQGVMAAQDDHQVADGILPTTCWQPGQIIVDKVDLTIADQASHEPHYLKVGLYGLDTLERLPLNDGVGSEHTEALGEIIIAP
ncbi:MAG: glycosyltransferase family 39 protein [Chloroflexota bacterium]